MLGDSLVPLVRRKAMQRLRVPVSGEAWTALRGVETIGDDSTSGRLPRRVANPPMPLQLEQLCADPKEGGRRGVPPRPGWVAIVEMVAQRQAVSAGRWVGRQVCLSLPPRETGRRIAN